MPMFVRDYSDDEATVIMVDTNIQREDILPSEKARAYAMKYEAMKHQGKKGSGSSLDEVGEAAGESGKTVQRYIWLARLSDEHIVSHGTGAGMGTGHSGGNRCSNFHPPVGKTEGVWKKRGADPCNGKAHFDGGKAEGKKGHNQRREDQPIFYGGVFQ